MSGWIASRGSIGLVLLGVLAAAAFVPAWGVAPGLDLPNFLEPVRASHPSTMLWWMDVLYVGTVIMTLIPAAAFWLIIDSRRRHLSALLAVSPLLVLLVADFINSAVVFDLPPRYGRLLWDAALMLFGSATVFDLFDVLRRLTMRWSGP